MTHCSRTLAILLFLAVLSGSAGAAERFPPPEFDSGHSLPETQYPAPRGLVFEVLDVAALFVALCLAAWLAFRRRSRTGLFVLMLVSLFYFGFLREGCVCPIGAIQNVALAIADRSYAVPIAVLAFFLLPLVFALFFGRVFCAAVCPLGAIQDVVLVHPLRVPTWLEHALRVLAYAYLGAAVLFAATGSAFVICQYDPFVAFFRLSGSLAMFILGACVLVVAMFVGRPYCRFLCPYGVLLGLLARASQRRVTISPAECVRCRLCEDSCPFGAIRAPAEAPSPDERRVGRKRLALLLGLLPVLVGLGLFAGGLLAVPFSKVHATVSLAERVRLEDTGKAEGTTDASEAFRETGRPTEELFAEAKVLRSRFVTGGRLLGAWLGLVIGIKLIYPTLRRRRTDYEADRGACLACGRCYDYCPVEHDRRKKAREAGAVR